MHVDHLVIGAGPSGLACALRLALSGAKVALVEKHTKIGGLNSFYAKSFEKNGEKSRIELDVGLHALTNYSDANNKSATLNKLFRSLRINRHQLELCQQSFSWIKYGDSKLTFTNDIKQLTDSIVESYPSEALSWNNFLHYVKDYNEFDANQVNYTSAKSELNKFFQNNDFIQHILFPVLAYGSPWEDDMDFNLFICIFRSMFLEGLCRPKGGIRAWWSALTENMEKFSVQMLLGESVQKIQDIESGEIIVTTSKREIIAQQVFTSAGLIETQELLDEKTNFKSQTSPLGFIELMVIFDKDFSLNKELPTLGFYAKDKKKYYHATKESINTDMAIYCFPSRYQGEQKNCQGMVRITCMTNPLLWFAYSAEEYKEEKNKIKQKMLEQLFEDFAYFKDLKIIFTDIFTPKTIHKYSWHHHGSLYGAKLKIKEGTLTNKKIIYIGADQGYPGITGSMLSGVSMANNFGIMNFKSKIIDQDISAKVEP